jgi:hypothetical protein
MALNYIQYFIAKESIIMHANNSDPNPEERLLKSCLVLTDRNHWFKGSNVVKWPITKGLQCGVIQHQKYISNFKVMFNIKPAVWNSYSIKVIPTTATSVSEYGV